MDFGKWDWKIGVYWDLGAGSRDWGLGLGLGLGFWVWVWVWSLEFGFGVWGLDIGVVKGTVFRLILGKELRGFVC